MCLNDTGHDVTKVKTDLVKVNVLDNAVQQWSVHRLLSDAQVNRASETQDSESEEGDAGHARQLGTCNRVEATP